jgi:hypothetical protein
MITRKQLCNLLVLMLFTLGLMIGFTACGSGGGGGGGGSTPADNPVSTYTISGKVADSTGAGFSGVTVALNGPSSSSTATDANGNYSFIGLANGSYTITPSKTGYTCNPLSITVAINNADATGQDFVGSMVVSWQITTIDSSADVGVGSSVAIDSNNKVHVSYYDRTNSAIKYATNSPGLWVTSTIDTNIDGGGSPSKTIIKVDSNNKLHIVYYKYNGVIKYATTISGSWTVSTIGSGDIPSMVIDTNNKLHLSYRSGTVLAYSTNATGAWVTQTVDAGGAYHSAIAIDKNGKVHILYGNGSNLKYANNTNGSWVLSTIDSASSTYNGLGIALDSNVKIHAAYGEYPTSWNLKYITNVTGSWVSTTIGKKSDNWSFTSLVVDTNDKIHVCAIGGSPRVQYLTNSSGAWVTDNIDDAQWSIAMALDLNNKAHIVYYATPMVGPLKYATNAN